MAHSDESEKKEPFRGLIGLSLKSTVTEGVIPPIEKLLYSIFYFIGFLIVMRLDIRLTVLVLLLIFGIYFLELNKDYFIDNNKTALNLQETEKEILNDHQYWITFDYPIRIRLFKVKSSDFTILNKLENILFYIIIILLIVGFISYGGEIKSTLNNSSNKLTWFDVIMDTNICKLKTRKSFWHYFYIGLGLKL